MSFSSLPPELVHQIIESTVPHTFHTRTYEQRQRTLCSLSLVSRLFRSIAQPLLFEIVKLKRLRDGVKLPQTRALAQTASFRPSSRDLIIAWDGNEFQDWKQEEKEQVLESLRVFETVTNLTALGIGQMSFEALLSITCKQLTYLQLSDHGLTKPNGLHLPRLYNLTLFSVSLELFIALTNPANVPNVRNFAFVKSHPSCAEYFTQSPFHLLLPQLHTLILSAFIWFDARVAYLHSAASRTLVDFGLQDAARFDVSVACPVHVRLAVSAYECNLYLRNRLEAQLDHWSALIQNNPSLSLRSIHLDPSMSTFDKLRLKKLTRVCQQHKVDLIFEAVPVYKAIDPQFSTEIVLRQKEPRGKESGGKRI